ncbi:hypothetical protein SAMN02745227_01150 [Anaerobranca californiensis DSM 14826]|jgi:hypothetical protein|uniref:Uncharacterized protein n=1 Tax=Anaerobranca californiensis DSM 14826 TaxID=1120989 RepID=A0A1M6NJF4_9FIRM|nr:NusG domain II-containing protein [Anaerobranca californiensis]SHJ95888.1 hypothetical protein SAMN02745227_01150 [Anaerobranca californiensis DSM 14826]
MKKLDFIIIVVVAALALTIGTIYYFNSDSKENAMIIIEVNGVEVGREPLYSPGRDKIVIYNGPVGETKVQFFEVGARVLTSDCPDKICILFGMMNRSGQSNACLPNRVVFRIIGDNKDTDINIR